jgi:hypothetical protein
MIMSWGEGLLCLTAFVSSNCDFGSIFLAISCIFIFILFIYFCVCMIYDSRIEELLNALEVARHSDLKILLEPATQFVECH